MKYIHGILLKAHAFKYWIGLGSVRRWLTYCCWLVLYLLPPQSLYAGDSFACCEDAYAVACLKEGISFMKRWYHRRAEMVRPDGVHYLTTDELQLICDRLDSAIVVLSRYPYVSLYEGLEAGRFHLYRHLVKNHPLNVCSERELRRMSEEYFALSSPDIMEPVIFINVDALWKANVHWSSNPGGIVYGTLQQVGVHEATHAATSGQKQDLVIRSLLSGLTITRSDPYLDEPSEIYARVNELRYCLDVDPTHIFSLEEIRAIRRRAKTDLKAYKTELRALGLRNVRHFSDLPFHGKLIDPQLFLRYSDEEILGFLNWTA